MTNTKLSQKELDLLTEEEREFYDWCLHFINSPTWWQKGFRLAFIKAVELIKTIAELRGEKASGAWDRERLATKVDNQRIQLAKLEDGRRQRRGELEAMRKKVAEVGEELKGMYIESWQRHSFLSDDKKKRTHDFSSSAEYAQQWLSERGFIDENGLLEWENSND